MASEGDGKPADIHSKYEIKRTSYDKKDLEKLSTLVQQDVDEHKQQMLNSACLKRFLRAHLNPKDSLDAIVRYVEWREKFAVDSINDSHSDVMREHAVGRCYVIDEKDRDGRPIVIITPRLHDPRTRDMQSLTNYTVYILEHLSQLCNEDIIDNFCVVFDLKGFALKNMDYAYVKRLIWILQHCYPERLGVCLIVNSPWIFYGCWSIIKLWINDVTRSKIIFIQNEEDLEDFFHLDKLPYKLI